ncbi:hypothetical protein [Tranquillimonas alkanivorans]|uniref:Invasion protein IalB, involved in pathogenesis n=1 Tax=Tranquillimonas alkanivorans TaxID=441119 RepID=A0A1I5TSG3_9RHOB|nr:hypothetical protein [Tranquillimonas alkanivorans]SFP85994.1 hypothetical protein SAMN04488047_1154 [Tranquillimonas alkanivorans]
MNALTKAVSGVFLAVSLCAPIAAQATQAETVQGAYTQLGERLDWQALRLNLAGTPICAIRTEAKTRSGGVTARGETVAFLTLETGDERPVFSYLPGARVAAGDTGARLIIDGEVEVHLVGAGDALYAHPDDDAALYQAFRKGRSAVIEATLPRIGEIRDEVSLMGVVATSAIMSREGC